MVKTLSLDEFKNNLDAVSKIPQRLSTNSINVIDIPTFLKDVEKSAAKMLDHLKAAAPQTKTPPQHASVKKNVILAIKSDSYGCGWVRCTQWMTYLDAVYGRAKILQPIISNGFFIDETLLFKTRSIYLQRCMTPEHLEIIKRLKEGQTKYRYKLIHEMDDQILDYYHDGKLMRGVPDYNSGQEGITQEIQQAYIDTMNIVDLLTVSTENIKTFLQKEAKIKTPIKVIHNVVPKHLWNGGVGRKITKKIEIPHILVTSSPTHYNNKKKMYGDFSKGWVDYLVNNLQEGKIKLTWVGVLPFFLEHLADKIEHVEWANSYMYPSIVMNSGADFCLMPLVPNQFNCSKSDLKNIECCAAGIIGIGADFTYRGYKSPYHYMSTKIRWDCTAAELERHIKSMSTPEAYNKIVEENLEYMEREGRWLESKDFIHKLIEVF